jgi:hypothetical protein
MRVRLVKKFAEKIDGIDLSEHVVGTSLQVEDREAQLLIAEGWAVPEKDKKKRAADTPAHSDSNSPPPERD